MINRKDVSNYSVAELIEFLIHSDEEICFSDYATKFINRMASEGHERNAKNYRLAVNHLERRKIFGNNQSYVYSLVIFCFDKMD